MIRFTLCTVSTSFNPNRQGTRYILDACQYCSCGPKEKGDSVSFLEQHYANDLLGISASPAQAHSTCAISCFAHCYASQLPYLVPLAASAWIIAILSGLMTLYYVYVLTQGYTNLVYLFTFGMVSTFALGTIDDSQALIPKHLFWHPPHLPTASFYLTTTWSFYSLNFAHGTCQVRMHWLCQCIPKIWAKVKVRYGLG